MAPPQRRFDQRLLVGRLIFFTNLMNGRVCGRFLLGVMGNFPGGI